METVFPVLWMLRPVYLKLRRLRWRYKRFVRDLYYGFTNTLVILGSSALIVGIWYFCFLR